MTPLEKILRARIAAQGPIPFDHYMEWCLFHPDYGYYHTRDPFGLEGDFVTSPEISQMFGEMVALWCYDVWVKMGEPDSFLLLECGPGRGTLMADVLRTCTIMPRFLQGAHIWLCERSPLLQQKQAATLKKHGVAAPVHWAETLSDVPDLPVIMFCNELFDTFPIRRFVKKAHGWCEVAVGVVGDRLDYVLLPPAARNNGFFVDAVYRNAKPDAVAEFCESSVAWLEQFMPRLARQPGAALIIDYAFEGPMAADTVQAIHAKTTAQLLEKPGDSDISAYVDFSVFRNLAIRNGLKAHTNVSQHDFLLRCGILQRASLLKQKATLDQQKSIQQDLDRLLGELYMGQMFKVFCMSHPALPAPLGF